VEDEPGNRPIDMQCCQVGLLLARRFFAESESDPPVFTQTSRRPGSTPELESTRNEE
jgi:hypothetical protein